MSLGLIVSGLDLIPVPAVIVVRETGTLRFPAFNRAYRLAGLGVVAERSPLLDALGDLIHDVLDRQEARAECDWTIGEAIDCRYYRVTIARSTLTKNEACVITLIDQTSQYNTERSLRAR